MGNSGGRPPSVTDDSILRALRESGEHVLTTPEIAEAVDVSRRTALRRLSALAEAGLVGRKEVGGRAIVWWPLRTESETESPIEALLSISGMLEETTADDAQARSEAWREEFDDQLNPGDD